MGKYANVQVSIRWFGRWVYLIHLCAGFLLPGCAYYDFDSLRPPARFDHPFAGKMTIVEVEPEEIWNYCSKGVACMVELTPTECRVIVNKAYANWKFEIMQHETAHCNGWSAAHEL